MSIGERGEQGDIGHAGPQGERGLPGVAPWVVREATKAYTLLWIGMLVVVFLLVQTRQTTFAKIEARRIAECEAGNQRSALQLEDYRTSLRQAREQNLERLLGLTVEQANDLRRLTVENAERRIAQVPFTNCKTGQRLPPALP